jgi:hypothetical protein
MIYIDELSLKTCLIAHKLVRAEKNHGIQHNVQVLDPIKKSLFSWFLQKGMRLFGISLYEAKFFAGYLRTKNGDSIWHTAKSILFNIAHEVAKKTINSSKDLFDLNEQWGRNTLLLYLSKIYYRVAGYGEHHTIFKILIADALSRDTGGEEHHLILGLPEGFTPDLIENIGEDLNLSTYSIKEWSIRKTRLSVLLLISYVSLNRLLNQISRIFQPKPEFGDVTKPALLLLEEDDLSMDRSYRGQPHWLSQEDKFPQFRTLILGAGMQRFMEYDFKELSEYSIYPFPFENMYCYLGKHPVQRKIYSSLCSILYLSVFGSRAYVDIVFQLALLFMKASLMAEFCVRQNIKVFMTCENYYHGADAMSLIGSELDIHTISYQYSNISEVGPLMMSNADTMFTFSPMFQERWKYKGIRPKSFIDVGYIFDSAFKLIIERSRDLRENLKDNGVEFVISYFDENIQKKDDKYGFLNEEDLYQELLPLIKLVNRDEKIAVIAKPQFQINSLSVLFKNDEMLLRAIQSGRWSELCFGEHRNNVLPAEAAMASDMVIGHVVGATAGLEAVLAGSRCILLNPYNLQGANIEIFKQADILYENMDSALSAISSFRQGKKEFKNLGEWDSIIDLFDPFRDGKSARRMREYIEKTITTE